MQFSIITDSMKMVQNMKIWSTCTTALGQIGSHACIALRSFMIQGEVSVEFLSGVWSGKTAP